MIALPKRPLPLIIALIFFFAVRFYHSRPDRSYLQRVLSIEALPDKLPANKTLGFGAIVVVSKEASDRRHSLLQAANVTDIQLTIPHQPKWLENDVQKFRNQQKDVPRGTILAWLGHRNALEWFLNSNLETALILEDDVDWDIRLRSLQVPLAASAVRTLLPPPQQFSPFAKHGRDRAYYWGNLEQWDLLYLGHCGDYFNEVTKDGVVPTERGFNLSDVPHIVYQDSSLPAKSDLHPFTRSLFDILDIHDYHRAFHRSKFPLCSFGYAITRAAAELLLTDLAPARLQPNGPTAFDVALLHACSKGSTIPSPVPNNSAKFLQTQINRGLRCWSLNSELFHHMPGESHIAQVGKTVGERQGIPPVDLAGRSQVLIRNETTNIDCGFWGGAFAFDKDEPGSLEFLQEHVGRKGVCLKPGRNSGTL